MHPEQPGRLITLALNTALAAGGVVGLLLAEGTGPAAPGDRPAGPVLTGVPVGSNLRLAPGDTDVVFRIRNTVPDDVTITDVLGWSLTVRPKTAVGSCEADWVRVPPRHDLHLQLPTGGMALVTLPVHLDESALGCLGAVFDLSVAAVTG
jgi:hypothetical protein